MKLLMKVAFICFSGLLCLNSIHCERTQNGLDMFKWACYCAANPLRVPNSTRAFNCSTSCHCIPDEGVSDSVIWNCFCAPVVTPKATGSINRSSCFASCNCTSGSTETSAGLQKFSNNSVMVLLLVLVVITTIALFVSIVFHFFRTVNVALQPRIYSSAKYTSSNSSANLFSHRSASFSSRQLQTDTQICSLTEFLRKIPFISRGEKQAIPGAIIQFSLFELEQATDRFTSANLIGEGGSSNIYRGKLMNGNIVAIKKLKVLGGTEADSSFLTEIEIISRLNHCHVVPLLGYCSEYQNRNCERLLVFEYMSNGNLRECLDAKHCKEPLSWATRVSIALGVARGLEYLHEAAAPRIMHRDIKSTNILLDECYKAKITDLGMAKCLMTDDHPSCSSSPARMLGTFGYFAPEYAIVGKASLQSDVFSYGVVILELITGRQPILKSSKGDESLVIWATARLNDSKLIVTELPDPVLKGNFADDEMQIMAHLARECLQWDPDSRPTMTEIVQILTMIAPEKQRRNFHVNIHMGSFWRSIKSINATDKSQHSSTARLELTQGASGRAQDYSSLSDISHENLGRSHAYCYFPATLDQNKNQEVVLSAEHMQKLTILASTIKSRNSLEEEVDLTEPRFESFL